jgi:leucine-zipper of insertion element IS481
MSHANAALTPRARLRLAQLVVERGGGVRSRRRCFMVSPRTAAKWEQRYSGLGLARVLVRCRIDRLSADTGAYKPTAATIAIVLPMRDTVKYCVNVSGDRTRAR